MLQRIDKIFFNSSLRLIESIEEKLKVTIDKLERIQDLHLIENEGLLKYGTDQKTMVHRILYKDFDEPESKIIYNYRILCLEWLKTLRNEYKFDDWALQRFPSVRVQFPGNISVFEFHRDNDYNHPRGEINHFLAITPCIETAALQVEKHLGWKDYIPLNLNKGESAILNTSIFKHGDLVNNENYTRISIDFRAIPVHILEQSSEINKSSLTKKITLDLNGYYISSNEL